MFGVEMGSRGQRGVWGKRGLEGGVFGDVKGCFGHIGVLRRDRGVCLAKRGVWWAKKCVWWRTAVFGGENVCREDNGVFGVQMECLGVFVGKQVCRDIMGYNGVFGPLMGCFWGFGGERGFGGGA